jgi:4-amino-4-deoxy-L-arabinose transferase-like glycosyltransferase
MRPTLFLVAAALVFRLVYWLLASGSLFLQTPVVDGSFFDIWARTLADGRVFQTATFFKPPLYPYLLSWFYKTGFSMTAVLVLQMLVGVGTVVLTHAVGRLVFSPRIAFAGALVTALLPILPFFETQLLAETWTTALTLGSLLLVLRVVVGRAGSVGRTLFLAGLLMGCAALGRPNLMLLIVAVAVWLWWQGRRGRLHAGRPVRMGSIGLLAAGFLLAVSPATLNNLKYGEFSLISANLGANLVAGNSDQADGVSAIPVGVLWDDLQLQTRQAGRALPGQASRYLMGQALDWAVAHPGRTLALLGKKILLMVNAQEGRNNINPTWFAREEGVILLARWWPATWLILPLAILGITFYRRWKAAGSLLVWVILVQAVAVLPFFVNARFRQPLLPLLALLAVASGAVLLEMWKARDRRGLTWRVGLLVVLVVVVNGDWFGLSGESWLARDWFNQGLIHSRPYADRKPDPAEAERCFRRAVALGPGEVDFNERLGAFLLVRAQPLVNAATQAEAKQDWARVAGAVARSEPVLREAREYHRKAVEIFPRSYRSWTNLGVSAKWLGDGQAALARALVARQDKASARTSALAALEYYKYSVEDYQKGLQVNPELEDSKKSINQVFRSVMALPGLDPSITDFQRRISEGARNRNQGSR